MLDTKVLSAFEAASDLYADILGYRPGERLTTAEDVARGIAEIARRAPDRTRLEEYGRTHQGRPLQLLTVASDANSARLDTIAGATRALCGRDGSGSAADLPATVWVIANVHGDEHSTAEAALLVALHLALGDEPALANVIVGVDPLQNPDGRARSVNSYYGNFGLFPRSDPWAAEHDDNWPGGRGNHYHFDLNRDWFPLTQPESRGKVAAFLKWRPQVLMDLHEMWSGSRFFFPPPSDPINPNTGETVRAWWAELGRGIGRTFDENGWDYWVRETFDAFYPGYGEAFPAMHGAAGMTFEQAGAAGLATERDDGTTQHLRDGILHHFGASLRVIRSCSAGRDRLLADFRRYFETAGENSKSFVFPASGAGANAEVIAETLRAQGIEVARLSEDANVIAESYDGSQAEAVLPAGSIVVSLDQPEARAARSVLERETTIDEAWLAEQLRRQGDGVETECYDHTVWSLPVAAGVDPVLVDQPIATQPWSPPSVHVRSEPAYGFLVPADGMAALRFASLLRDAGVRVHVARRPVHAGGVDRPRGAVIVKRPDQTAEWADVCARVAAAAGTSGVQPIALEGAWTDSGITLGSDNVSLVMPNRVAVLYGEPGRTLSYGWMAHLFEQRLGYPFTPMRLRALGEADLRRYDVLVLPHGRHGDWSSALGDHLKKLKAWVELGGTLIAIGGAARMLAEKGKDWTSCRIVKDLRHPEGADPAAKPEDEQPVPTADRPVSVAGAALRVRLDRHHWSTLGYGERSHVLYTSDLLLTPSVDGRNVITFEPEESLVKAGYVWERMRPALPGKAYLVDETHGRGHVLLFADDPNTRGYWDVTSRLFANAVLFAPGRVA